MNDDITMAQVKAGEGAAVERLRRKGLLPPEATVEECYRAESVHIFQRQQLEHQLATTFVALQKTNVPTERQRIWSECLRLAGELERLNEHD